MRLPFLMLAVPLLALPAQAETTKHHLTWEQRFEKANTTHDGHLTLDQAKAGYASMAKHFTAIDKDNKGYVTEDDIRAYYKAQHAAHRPPTTGKSQPSS